MKPSAEQHRHPDPCFDRWENRPEIRSQAQAVISELLVVEVLACLDVVDRSSQVLRPFNNVVAVGGGLRPGQRLVPAFVSALIDWVNERSAALDDEVASEEIKIPAGPCAKGSVDGKKTTV